MSGNGKLRVAVIGLGIGVRHAERYAKLEDARLTAVLLDTYHLYAGPSKLEDLDLLAAHSGRLRFVHVNDVPAARPRELWTDADRVLPGDGDLPLTRMLGAIRQSGYSGDVSLELFNVEFATRWDEDPVAAAAEAFRRVSGLLEAVDRGPGVVAAMRPQVGGALDFRETS